MLNHINYRILLIIVPIIACTAVHYLAFSTNYAENILNVSDQVCCGLFAMSAATIMPNSSKKWMIGGTCLSYCLMLYLLMLILPSFKNSEIVAALLTPITCSIFAPGKHNKHQPRIIRLNYFMAGMFLIIISLALVPIIAYLYDRIESIINSTYLSTFYNENISFIYGMLYQFFHTVGIANFITELRTISPESGSSISFYATTVALNFCALPAVFVAIAANQEHRRRLLWGIFAVASFFCPPAGTSVSLLLLTLLLRYPFIYAFYMILCIVFYFIGQYIDFSITLMPNHFYNPDLNPIEISILRPKFILFGTLVFISTLNFTNMVIRQNKIDRDYKSTTLPLVNSIKIDFTMDAPSNDYSFQGYQYIKALGGFNNITFCRPQNNRLLFNIINIEQANRELLEQLCTVKFTNDGNNNIVELTIDEHSQEIQKSIVRYARRQYLDIETEYQDIPPFDIMKSDFKKQFAERTPSNNSSLPIPNTIKNKGSHMPWIQIKVSTTEKKAIKINNILSGFGAASVTYMDTVDNPVYEPLPGETKLWNKTTVIGLFEADFDTKQVTDFLDRTYGTKISWKVEQLEDKDWVREWMNNFHPLQCGEKLWICPSWCEIPHPEAVNVMLDPGLAFGTGTHPTTFMCLNWLDGLDLKGKQILDFGCGSGILAVSALKLGAASAIGIDIDPQAIEASTSNAQRNEVASNLQLYLPHDQPEKIQADVLVANILAGPLRELAPVLKDMVKPGGLFAISGIIKTQCEELTSIYSEWFELDEPVFREDWVRISGVRKS